MPFDEGIIATISKNYFKFSVGVVNAVRREVR